MGQCSKTHLHHPSTSFIVSPDFPFHIHLGNIGPGNIGGQSCQLLAPEILWHQSDCRICHVTITCHSGLDWLQYVAVRSYKNDRVQ